MIFPQRLSDIPASSASEALDRRRLALKRRYGYTALALGLLAFMVPVKYVVENPGPTFNTIGDYEGKQLIQIEGRKTYPVSGQLDLTTVSVAGGPNTNITVPYALSAFFSSSSTVVPSDLLYAPTVTSEQVSAQNTAAMTDSQEVAQAVALDYVGEKYTQKLVVSGLTEQSPSQGQIQESDILLEVNGKKLERYADLSDVVNASAGKELTITLEREGKRQDVQVTPSYKEKTKSYLLGLLIKREYGFPFTVSYGLEKVGGPSAGLMFTLGIIDELTPEDMTGGKHFAGTGTIQADGSVGAIGGAPQKLIGAKDTGAEVFLLPQDNCADVRGKVPEGLAVIPVKDLRQAADVVKAIGSGAKDAGSFGSCPAS